MSHDWIPSLSDLSGQCFARSLKEEGLDLMIPLGERHF